jgi:hypothetical protein
MQSRPRWWRYLKSPPFTVFEREITFTGYAGT